MLEVKDTSDVNVEFDLNLKKAVKNNYLFFSKRCRSRSFIDIHELMSEESNKENECDKETLFGYGLYGQRFEFSPKSYLIASKYIIEKKLFEEILSPTIVWLTTCNETQKKVIKKSTIKSKLLSDEHKNVIELYEYTESDEDLDLFLEYANKATYLTDLIHEQHTPLEDQVLLKKLAKDILEGLAYIHNEGIIHGDLKLENMLCNEEDGVISIKICDFGFSYILDVHRGNKVLIRDVSGTIGHIAPEVKHNCIIGTEVDMWCYGLMLYELTVAYKPTQIKNYTYSDGEIPFRKVDWRRKSPELQDLISKCMSFNPEDRISAEEALKHPWFSEEN